MLDLKTMTLDELAEARASIDAEMNMRKDERFRELAAAACKALETLRTEFPMVSYIVDIVCPDCEVSTEYDLFEEVTAFFATDFKP